MLYLLENNNLVALEPKICNFRTVYTRILYLMLIIYKMFVIEVSFL